MKRRQPARVHGHDRSLDRGGRMALVARAAARGATVEVACRIHRVSASNYYRWQRATRASNAGSGVGVEATRAPTRAAIVSAARRVFLRDGIDASLHAVAAAAGVSRQTIYNLFGGRDRLFGEVVQALYEQHLAPVLDLGAEGDLRQVLEQCARHQIGLMTDPEAVGLLRITLGEYPRRPELALLAYAMRAGGGTSTLTHALAHRLSVEIARGTLEPLDTVLAAQTFIGSCTAHVRHRALIGLAPPAAAEVEERVQMAVQLFLRGLGYQHSAPRTA